MLRPGTKVRIHDHWSGAGPVCSNMNRFLGQIMTIKESISHSFYIMEEDEGDGPEYQNGHWHFVVDDFDVVDAVGDADTGLFVAPTDQDFLRLFGIGGE